MSNTKFKTLSYTGRLLPSAQVRKDLVLKEPKGRKVMFVLEQAMKAQKGGRNIALLFLQPGR
jgi:hypothetical protein